MYFKDCVFSVGGAHYCRCSREWAEQERSQRKKIQSEGEKNTRKGRENNSTQLLFYPERQPVGSQTGNPNTKRSNDFINHAAAFTAPCDRQMCLSTNSSPVNSCQFTIIKTGGKKNKPLWWMLR